MAMGMDAAAKAAAVAAWRCGAATVHNKTKEQDDG
jgi:hypothetical protein